MATNRQNLILSNFLAKKYAQGFITFWIDIFCDDYTTGTDKKENS